MPMTFLVKGGRGFMAEEICKGAGLEVLVAEDNVVSQALVTRFVERAGHRAVVVANGEQAIALLERRGHFGRESVEEPPFDLVLMDMQMPVMGGEEATRIIRARERDGSKRIVIVALSANAIPEDGDEYLIEGIDEYLMKPIDSQRLYEIFDECVKKKVRSDT